MSFSSNLLTVSKLHAFQGEKLVLKDINFSLSSGQSLIIQGPNGVGKSTLLRILAGFKQFAAGQILWNSISISNRDSNYSNDIAWLGHVDALKPAMTVKENLSLFSTLYNTDVIQALEAVELPHLLNIPVRILSAGQKRRIAIARILLKPAQLWLLDEPTVGLDSHTIQKLAAIFTNFQQQGGMIIATTHIPLPLQDNQQLVLSPISFDSNRYL